MPQSGQAEHRTGMPILVAALLLENYIGKFEQAEPSALTSKLSGVGQFRNLIPESGLALTTFGIQADLAS